MGIFSSMLVQAHLRPSAARWFSLLICAASINIFGVVLVDLISPDYPLGLRAISLGRAFIPFCMLGLSLVFPYRRRIANSRLALFGLALPSLVTVVVTDPCFAPGDVSYQLCYHIPWMGGYFLWSYFNLFFSFRHTRLRITKRQHLLLTLASVPATAMHYATSILLPALGMNHIWRYNWLPILVAFCLLPIGFIRYGMIGRRARFTRSLLDRSIDMAGMSSQMVTHAVKNSLQLMRSLAETASAGECPDRGERLKRIASLCDELAEKMNRLNLLTRARICRPVDRFRVSVPIERAIERAGLLAVEIRIARNYRQDPIVICDGTHLEEVFFNLLSNAAEAMPGGGGLCIETRVENDWVVIGLHDQGPGIPPEQLARIFEPFRTTKVSRGNWGIGLSYCHAVLRELGGDLFAESTAGKGSSFFVVLPLPEKYGNDNSFSGGDR